MNILNKIRETLERISRNESLVGGLVVWTLKFSFSYSSCIPNTNTTSCPGSPTIYYVKTLSRLTISFRKLCWQKLKNRMEHFIIILNITSLSIKHITYLMLIRYWARATESGFPVIEMTRSVQPSRSSSELLMRIMAPLICLNSAKRHQEWALVGFNILLSKPSSYKFLNSM
jgi:hypothetical protein